MEGRRVAVNGIDTKAMRNGRARGASDSMARAVISKAWGSTLAAIYAACEDRNDY
jgi:hypothetical protein